MLKGPLRIASVLLISISLLVSCNKKQHEKTELRSSTLDIRSISSALLDRIGIQKGEKVFMIGAPGEFDSLIVLLAEGVKAKGGVYLGVINVDTVAWPASWKNDFVATADSASKEELIKFFEDIDLGIMLPGAAPSDKAYGAWQEVLKKGRGRAVHFHWSGVYDLNQQPVIVDSAISLMYQNAIINTDYSALAVKQSALESAMRNQLIEVTTALGTKLSFSVGDRPVTRQDGDASKSRSDKARNLIDREVEIPAGAIRVAPLEETVNGIIAYPPMQWGDQKVEGLLLTFSKGKITNIQAASGLELAKKVFAPMMEGYAFREIAVGFNTLLTTNEKNNVPYYGYGMGVVRLSLGNNEELGGVVGGDFVYMRFFLDATVTIGNEIWIKDGKFTK
ncbi:hypothetical protein BH09BAC3_BH09BAC3_31980 [soil metagenome]